MTDALRSTLVGAIKKCTGSSQSSKAHVELQVLLGRWFTIHHYYTARYIIIFENLLGYL